MQNVKSPKKKEEESVRQNKTFTSLNALWTEGSDHLRSPLLSLEQPEWLSDKQTYYWALIDQSTGRPARSKDSRSYFIALLISPNSPHFIFSFSLFPCSLTLLSLFVQCQGQQVRASLTAMDHCHWKRFDVLFKVRKSTGILYSGKSTVTLKKFDSSASKMMSVKLHLKINSLKSVLVR